MLGKRIIKDYESIPLSLVDVEKLEDGDIVSVYMTAPIQNTGYFLTRTGTTVGSIPTCANTYTHLCEEAYLVKNANSTQGYRANIPQDALLFKLRKIGEDTYLMKGDGGEEYTATLTDNLSNMLLQNGTRFIGINTNGNGLVTTTSKEDALIDRAYWWNIAIPSSGKATIQSVTNNQRYVHSGLTNNTVTFGLGAVTELMDKRANNSYYFYEEISTLGEHTAAISQTLNNVLLQVNGYYIGNNNNTDITQTTSQATALASNNYRWNLNVSGLTVTIQNAANTNRYVCGVTGNSHFNVNTGATNAIPFDTAQNTNKAHFFSYVSGGSWVASAVTGNLTTAMTLTDVLLKTESGYYLGASGNNGTTAVFTNNEATALGNNHYWWTIDILNSNGASANTTIRNNNGVYIQSGRTAFRLNANSMNLSAVTTGSSYFIQYWGNNGNQRRRMATNTAHSALSATTSGVSTNNNRWQIQQRVHTGGTRYYLARQNSTTYNQLSGATATSEANATFHIYTGSSAAGYLTLNSSYNNFSGSTSSGTSTQWRLYNALGISPNLNGTTGVTWGSAVPFVISAGDITQDGGLAGGSMESGKLLRFAQSNRYLSHDTAANRLRYNQTTGTSANTWFLFDIERSTAPKPFPHVLCDYDGTRERPIELDWDWATGTLAIEIGVASVGVFFYMPDDAEMTKTLSWDSLRVWENGSEVVGVTDWNSHFNNRVGWVYPREHQYSLTNPVKPFVMTRTDSQGVSHPNVYCFTLSSWETTNFNFPLRFVFTGIRFD